jgi:hypothetical protein
MRHMLAPHPRPHPIQNDIGNPRLNRRVVPIYRMPPPLSFQPALILHDRLHIGNFRSDDFGIAHNYLPLIRNPEALGFRCG